MPLKFDDQSANFSYHAHVETAPVQMGAGIQLSQKRLLDSRLRGNDNGERKNPRTLS